MMNINEFIFVPSRIPYITMHNHIIVRFFQKKKKKRSYY